jgi:hypothetical protein
VSDNTYRLGYYAGILLGLVVIAQTFATSCGDSAPTPPEMMSPTEIKSYHDLNDRRTACVQCCASNGLPYAYGHKQHDPIEGPGCWCRSGSGYSLVPVTTCQAVLQ